MTDIDRIRSQARLRGITRLCHFTPSRKLAHILSNPEGILAPNQMETGYADVFDATDPHRFDGFTGHVCCSVEYPNTWYLNRAKEKDPVFKDWVVILIDPKAIWLDDTLFCYRNASAGYGAYVSGGLDGFSRMFAEQSEGAYGKVFVRSSRMLKCCPTDGQAEVLVNKSVPRDAIVGVAVNSREQAETETYRLGFISGVMPVKWIVCPAMFDGSWRNDIEQGKRPAEIVMEEFCDE